MVRTDKDDPATNEEAVAVWRLTVKDPDERKVGRAVSSAMVELGLATIPGFFGVGGGPGEGRAYGVYRPAVVPADLVPAARRGARRRPDRGRLGRRRHAGSSTVAVAPAPGPPPHRPVGETVAAPLGRVVGARSGDKGGNANLGVFARSDEGVGLARRLPHGRPAAGAAAGDGGPRRSTATGCPRCGRSTS